MSRVRHRIVVRDADDRPLVEAVLALARSSVPFPEIALLTDESGAVELRLPPGVFTFRIRGAGDIVADVEVRSPGPTESVVRLKAR